MCRVADRRSAGRCDAPEPRKGNVGRERPILSLHYVHRPVPVCPCTYNRCAVPRLCEGRLARGDGIAYSGRHGDGRPKFVRFQRA